jgi:GT2 family glycosyltransferase
MDLSIVIVSYKAREEMKVALEAVFASQTSYSYEVIVVDNGSGDGTLEMIREQFLSDPALAAKTQLYQSTNEGFGKGNNRGIEMTKGQYVLLLNPDTKMAPDTIQVMMDFMKQRPDIGIATCKLMKANGELDWACRRSFPDPAVAFYRLSGLSKIFRNSKKFAAYNLTYKSIDEETEIDSCVGAFMLISPECLKKIKGFDEDYFMYGEDIDMCYRAKQAGFKVWYYPKTTTIHYKGQASKKESKLALWAFHQTMWVFYKKHLYQKYNPLFSALVYVGIWARYYQKLLFNAFRREKFVSR